MGRMEWIERSRLEKHIKALTIDSVNIRTRLQQLLSKASREVHEVGEPKTPVIDYRLTEDTMIELIALAGSRLPTPP